VALLGWRLHLPIALELADLCRAGAAVRRAAGPALAAGRDGSLPAAQVQGTELSLEELRRRFGRLRLEAQEEVVQRFWRRLALRAAAAAAR